MKRRIDLVLFVALFLSSTLLVGLTADDVGFTRDEGYYFKAGQQYWGWFEAMGEDPTGALQKRVIDKHMSYNPEHPALLKLSFALSYGILHKGLGVFERASTAMRFPAWCFSGLSVALVFLLVRMLVPRRRSAVLAALLWLLMPRTFWHMHLACFDIAICAAHIWLVAAYLRGRSSWRGAIVVGIAFGLAASVKHNVLVAPAFFVLHWLLLHLRTLRFEKRGFVLAPVPLAFFAMAIIGPLVFVACWPYLWPDIGARIGSYLAFHLHHEHYPILYFGDLLTAPPFPIVFPFVMSALTIPVGTLMLLIAGGTLATVAAGDMLYRSLRGRASRELTLVPLFDDEEGSGSAALLLWLNAAFPFFLIAMPSSPIFGGTKHWMNALPFLLALGVWALEEGVLRLGKEALFYVAAAVLVLASALSTSHVAPYGLSSYNALAGFTRGAANLGMQRTFWGYETRAALPAINAAAKKNARIQFGDTNYDSYRFYRADGLLRKDIRWTNTIKGADVASVQPQGEFKEQWRHVRNEWMKQVPDLLIDLDGVPLCAISYREP